jgi:hypothetical protein
MREEEEEAEGKEAKKKKNPCMMYPRRYTNTECRSNQTVASTSSMAHYRREADIDHRKCLMMT